MRWLRRMLGEPLVEGEALEPDASRVFSVPVGQRVYAVGDVHGRAALLEQMLAAIVAHAAAHPCEKITEVFLGDYVDRGMQSRAVIDHLLAAPAPGHQRVCLMGNHEETMLNFLDNPSLLRAWGTMGGYATLAAYEMGIPAAMTPEALIAVRDQLLARMPLTHVDFLRQLHLRHLVGDYLFVHAGIDPRRPLEKQTREHLLWVRTPFLNYQPYHDYYIVHGHSPVSVPDIRHNRANLDVSGAAVDSLCCLMIEGDQRRVMMVTREGVDLSPIK